MGHEWFEFRLRFLPAPSPPRLRAAGPETGPSSLRPSAVGKGHERPRQLGSREMRELCLGLRVLEAPPGSLPRPPEIGASRAGQPQGPVAGRPCAQPGPVVAPLPARPPLCTPLFVFAPRDLASLLSVPLPLISEWPILAILPEQKSPSAPSYFCSAPSPVCGSALPTVSAPAPLPPSALPPALGHMHAHGATLQRWHF